MNIHPKEELMKNDKHTTAIPEVAITQAHGQISAVIQQLQQYTIALTSHERQIMLKMWDKGLAFVEKAHDYTVDNPVLTPVTWIWRSVASMINVKQAFSNSPHFFLFQEMCGTATFLFRDYGRLCHNGIPAS
jgi:hypothetical protein